MKILLYLLVPVMVVAAFATVSWFRNRQPTSLDSGIDAFQREMRALSPEAAPLHRRRDPGAPPAPAARRPSTGTGSGGQRPPRRPPGSSSTSGSSD